MKGLLRTLGFSFIALSSYAMASEVNYYVIADQARPFQIEQQGEQHSGIVTDIVSAIFAESDYEVKYHTYPFKRMISVLEAGEKKIGSLTAAQSGGRFNRKISQNNLFTL